MKSEIEISNLFNRKIIADNTDKSALQLIHENFIDWMHACGGKGRCTSCKMIVEKGMENLSDLTKPEINYRDQGRLASNERLSCQTKVLGPVKIKVADKNKFPHIKYSD